MKRLTALFTSLPLLAACGLASAPQDSRTPLGSTPGSGTHYYVDCAAGSDGNNGTSPSTPWLTLTHPNATQFKGGDQLSFKVGTECMGSLELHGPANNQTLITVAPYGSGPVPAPIIHTVNRVDGGPEQVIYLHNQSAWRITGLDLTGSGVKYGVHVYEDQPGTYQNIQLDHLAVHDVTGLPTNAFDGSDVGAVVVWSVNQQAGGGLSSVTISDNTISHIAQAVGILVKSDDKENPLVPVNGVTVARNTVTDTREAGIKLGTINGGLIQSNVVSNTGNWSDCAPCNTSNGIAVLRSTQVQILSNETYGNHSQAHFDGCGIDLDVDNVNCTIEYNYSHDNDNAGIEILAWTGQGNVGPIVAYNVFANNGQAKNSTPTYPQADILVSQDNNAPLQGLQLFNNISIWTLPGVPQLWLKVGGGSNKGGIGASFANNILINFSSANLMLQKDPSPAGTTQVTFDYNLYYPYSSRGPRVPQFSWDGKTYSGLSAFTQGAQSEAHGLNADPLLVDDTQHAIGNLMPYQLQAGSPAIDVGSKTQPQPAQDLYGKPMPPDGLINLGVGQSR